VTFRSRPENPIMYPDLAGKSSTRLLSTADTAMLDTLRSRIVEPIWADGTALCLVSASAFLNKGEPREKC
jgi:hypothetical protein